MKNIRNWAALGLMAFGIAMRALPYVLDRFGLVSVTEFSTYTWNISPVSAMCLLGGAFCLNPWLGFAMGFVSYLLSDILISLISGVVQFGFYPSLPFVYGGFLLFGLIGLTLRKNPAPVKIATAALVGELSFFLLSNFGVWITGEGQYSMTPAGLIECYVASLPFLKNSMLGMCIYAPILFGLAKAIEAQPMTGVERGSNKVFAATN